MIANALADHLYNTMEGIRTVASSSTIMFVGHSSARAKETNCRWPELKFEPEAQLAQGAPIKRHLATVSSPIAKPPDIVLTGSFVDGTVTARDASSSGTEAISARKGIGGGRLTSFINLHIQLLRHRSHIVSKSGMICHTRIVS